MTSEIRTNTLTSRAGLSTVTLTDSGPMFSGITTFVDNSGFNLGTGSSIFSPATNTLTFGTNNTEKVRVNTNGVTVTGRVDPAADNTHDLGTNSVRFRSVYAHTLYGNGSNLTGVSGVSIANQGNDRLITATGTTDALNAEANLTMTGNVLQFNCTGNTHGMRFVATGDHYNTISFDSNRSSADAFLNVIDFKWDGDKVADIVSVSGSDTTNKDDGHLVFRTSPSQGSIGERLRILSSGELLVNTSNKINTSPSKFQVAANDATGSAIFARFNASVYSSYLDFYKSRNNTLGSATVVNSDDHLGSIRFYGADGSNSGYTTAAEIYGSCDGGSSSSGDMPGRITFHTRPDGAGQSMKERIRITKEGYLFIRDNSVTQTNTTLSYQSEGAFITHYTARTTAGGDRYRRMLDIASVGANPHGSSIRLLTSNDDTNPAVTVERVRITHQGRVGINKTTPQTMLSIKAERSAVPRFGIDGHYSDSSYTQSTWDDTNGLYTLLGVNDKLDANGNDSAPVSSLHSASILLDGRSGNIRFNVKQNSGSNTTEVMRVRDTGCVHIGNSLGAAAAGRLQVVEERGGQQTNDCNAYFETNANDWNIKTYYNSTGSHYHIVFLEQGSTRGSISGSDGSNVNYTQGSDYRWKENIVEMTGTEGIEICKKLKPSKYNWIENREETGQINTVDGFIAHEVVEAGVLGAVNGDKDAVNEDGSIKGQELDYGQMTPVLAAGIKGLIEKVETLEQENIALRARVTNLEGQ